MTLGEILKKYREKNRITIDQFSNITKIPQKVILNLESDNYNELLGVEYIKNYIKVYSRYLRLDEKKLLSLYIPNNNSNKQSSRMTGKPEFKVYLTPKIIKIVGILLIAIILISYLFFQVSKIFKNPYLEVTVPHQDLVIIDNFIQIIGLTEREATVFINDREIVTDGSGYFKVTLDLNHGINLIKISAKKKHSKETVIFREILVK